MKTMRRGTSILLCLALLVAAIPVILPVFTSATAADDQEEQLLGTLSQRFEASGPGVISSGSGDAGGKSYGAYQFSSRSDIPRAFFRWCQSSSDTYYRSIGNRLSAAYDADGGYGSNFDATWRALANEDSDGFLRVQRNYVRRSYYDPIVRSIESAVPGFDMDNYSIALRNVFWSRAVQHGVGGSSGFSSSDGRGGATGVIMRAFDALGGFANQPEAQLIEAIYNESGAVREPQSDSYGVMTGPTADKYGVTGKVLKYYDGNSGDVQLGVYARLRINEPAKAQVMLADYGFKDATVGEGVYQLRSSANSKLTATPGSSGLTLNAVGSGKNQQFRLDYHASGYYTITCQENGLRLTAGKNGVTLAKASTDNGQLWKAAVYNSGFSLQNRINEPAKAQVMLADYGFKDATVGEGVYQLRSSANSKLTATPGSSGLTLNAVGSGKNQQFRLDYHASGYYTITCQENGLRLTAGKNGVTLAKASTDNGQLWKAAVYNSGFSLQNRGTGSYLSVSSNAAGGRLILADTAMQWQLALAGAGWTLDGASYPTVNSTLTVGQTGFPFRGTLRNAYDIRRVTVSILRSNGTNAITPATAAPNAKSYDLSRLDDAVAFSRLGVGGYTLVIAAENTAGDNYRLESKFYVTDGSYVVSFDPCGGTCSESTRLVSAGQKYGNLPTAVKDGCAFVGWFTQPDGGQQITANSTTGASNITLYAHYQGQYTYQFVNYDGSVYAQGKLTAGQTIPRPAGTPTRPADSQYTYTFTGWQGYTNGMTISGNVTFTAQYAAKAVESVPKEITTGAYRIADSYLRAIPMGTTARQLLANLSPSDYITLPVQGDSLVGTGMTVTYARDGQTIQTLTTVVTGDLSGDGWVTITDMVRLQAHLLGRTSLTGAALQAADLNGDGQVTITDMVRLQAYLLGRGTIQPN